MGEPWVAHSFRFLGQNVDWQLGLKQIVGVSVILILTVINCFSVAFGGKVHVALTLLKVGGIAFIVVGIFAFSSGANWSTSPRQVNRSGMFFCVWSRHACGAVGYDGWNNMQWPR